MGVSTQSFIVRERKKEIARLEKRKGEIVKRVADMKDAIALIEQQIADHWAEIRKTEAP
jgi:prefoldin subunit 5